MEIQLEKFGSFLLCWVIGSLTPALAGAEPAVAAAVEVSQAPGQSATTSLIPDPIWLIGLALIAVVAITRRHLK